MQFLRCMFSGIIVGILCFTGKRCLDENYHTLYHFKTYVLEGDQSNNGLYAEEFHNDTGLFSITLTSDISHAVSVLASGRYEQIKRGWSDANLSTFLPGGLVLGSQYAPQPREKDLMPVQLKPTYGDERFMLDKFGRLVTTNDTWSGWIVCNGTHDKPQLFWRQKGKHPMLSKEPGSTCLPESCAVVELKTHRTGSWLKKASANKWLLNRLPLLPNSRNRERLVGLAWFLVEFLVLSIGPIIAEYDRVLRNNARRRRERSSQVLFLFVFMFLLALFSPVVLLQHQRSVRLHARMHARMHT